MRARRIAFRTIRSAIVIRRPVAEAFDFYRDFRNLPRFLNDVMHVEITGRRTSTWTIQTPFGFDTRWPVVVTQVRANAAITYNIRSLIAPVRWHVAFTATPDGATEVVKEMRIPVGRLAEKIFSIFGTRPEREAQGNLSRLKELLEREANLSVVKALQASGGSLPGRSDGEDSHGHGNEGCDPCGARLDTSKMTG